MNPAAARLFGAFGPRRDTRGPDDGMLSGVELGRTSGDEVPEEIALPAGTAVHRYVIVERVGVDATASIYAAYDPKLDRKVAVKVLRGSAIEDDAGRLLLAEAQSLAKLTHPNVVRVHDVGTFEDQVFVAREFVEGRSLLRWMREAPRSRVQIQHALALAGRGLAAAHEAGIVHGGIRPRSVLVGDDGEVRVTDFGVGAAADETKPYAAPEVRRGEPSTARSDQFAFCLMGLEALTGHPAAGLAPDGIPDLARIRELARRLPRRILAALELGLSAETTARHPTVLPIVAQLEPHRRNRRALVAFGLSLAIGAAAFASTVSRGSYCDDVVRHLDGVWDVGRRRAIRSAFERTEQPYAADAVASVEARLDQLAEAWVDAQTSACLAAKETGGELQVVARRMYCLERRLDELRAVTQVFVDADADVVRRALDVVHGVRPPNTCDGFSQQMPAPHQREAVAAIEASLSQAHAMHSAGRSSEASTLTARLVAEAEALDYAPIVVRTVAVRAMLADSHVEAEKQELLHDAFSRALAVGDRDLLGELAHAIASELTERRRYDEASRWIDYAEALLHGVVVLPTQPGLAAATSLRGRLASLQGRYDEAVKHFEDALVHRIAMLGTEHERVAPYRVNLAQTYLDLGRYADADREYRAALELQRNAVGEHHPTLAHTHMGLAGLMNTTGQAEQGVLHAGRALEILRAIHGEEHALVGDAYVYVAGALSLQGLENEAIEHFERALAAYRVTTGDRSYRAALVYSNIAGIRVAMGEAQAGEELYRQAIERLHETLGEGHPAVLLNRGNRGESLLALGRFDEAEHEANAVIEGLAKRLGPDHPSASTALDVLAEVHAIRGRDDASVAALERALELRADRGELERAYTNLLLTHALRRAGRKDDGVDTLEAEARAALADAGPHGAVYLRSVERSQARITAARSRR